MAALLSPAELVHELVDSPALARRGKATCYEVLPRPDRIESKCLTQPVNNFSKTGHKLQVSCYNYIRVKKLSDDSSGYIMTGNKPRGYRIKLK